MADVLTRGEYSISSMAGRQSRVGHYPLEDKSLNLIKIVSLPHEFQEFGVSISDTKLSVVSFFFQRWSIEPVNGGQYIVKSRGATTTVVDHLVLGILFEGLPPQEWLIKAQPQHGRNVYTIEKQYSGEGWVLPDPEDQNVQVACRPLIVGRSDPSHYLANELWLILPIVV